MLALATGAGGALLLFLAWMAGTKHSITRELFPEPLTPVTTVRQPRGKLALTWWRLFA